jgi:hypothetical protein
MSTGAVEMGGTGPDDDAGDTAMHSGSDAGAPGDRPLLGEPEGDFPEESDAAVRAAADDVPLPADGGPQGDGLEPEFSAPGQ